MTEENNFNKENLNESSSLQNSAVNENVSEEAAQNSISESENPPSADGGNKAYGKLFFDPKHFEEKAEIKRAGNIIGSAFIFMTGVVFLLNLAIVIVAAILQSSALKAAEIIWEPAVLQAQQIFFAMFSFTVPFIVVLKFANIRISSLISFSLPKKQTAVPFFLFGIAFCSFANIASSVAESIFRKTNIDYEVNFPENPSGISGFMLSLLSTVAVPALVEEFACRGIILGFLRKFGDGFAVIASAVLFGLMHGNFEQMPFAFLVGLVLGFITVKSGTILIAVAVHAFNNLISVLFSYLPNSISIFVQNATYTVFLVICLLLGIAAIFLFNGNDKDLYKFKESDMVTSEKKKLVWFFTSVPIIIYIVVCLIESLQYFIF